MRVQRGREVSNKSGFTSTSSDSPDVLAKIDLKIIEMHLFWLSGTFADVWYESIPPTVHPTCAMTPCSTCRERGGLSHLQDTRTQGSADFDSASKRAFHQHPCTMTMEMHWQGLIWIFDVHV